MKSEFAKGIAQYRHKTVLNPAPSTTDEMTIIANNTIELVNQIKKCIEDLSMWFCEQSNVVIIIKY